VLVQIDSNSAVCGPQRLEKSTNKLLIFLTIHTHLNALLVQEIPTVAVTAAANTLLSTPTLVGATTRMTVTGIVCKGIPWSLFPGCFMK